MGFAAKTEIKAKIVYNAVLENPGLRAAGVARTTGYSRNVVMRLLPALEHFSFLLWEDEDRRLYPFRPKMIDWDAIY